MSERPYVNFQQVKERVTIPEALEKLGLLDQYTETKGVWAGVCPIKEHVHGPRPNQQQFKFDNKRGEWLWHCFGDCAASDRRSGGDVIELVKGIEGLDNSHVRFWFADNFGGMLELTKPEQDRRPDKEDKDGAAAGEGSSQQSGELKPLKFYLNVDTAAAREYLHKRGISLATAEHYGVGLYTKPGKMFTGYLVAPCYRYPVQSEEEYPVGYVGRWPGEDFDDEHPRYKTGFDCSNAIYGMAEALESSREEDPLIVVEGFLKTLWLVDRGYTNTVSTFTASLSDVQAELLASTGRPIVLAFDGDERGLAAMRTAAGKLIKRAFVRVVALPDGKEPDELQGVELEEHFGFARPKGE